MKTFFSVFIILMFIFVLQTIWLYISELAGKDLDIWIVLKFLWYVSPRLIPLVLPLTVLVTSLMVFGSFSEKYEFAAMKSTGISLQRAMKSVLYFIVGLSIFAFFFANNVIPYSEYKWQNLRRNIAQVSPSMAIVEGQFSSIGDNFNIKVAEKFGDREQFLREVVIHQKDPKRPNRNSLVIIAKEGELASEEGSNTLSLILKDGNYYNDVQLRSTIKQRRRPFAKSYFEEYTINIDLTELNDSDIDKDNDISNHNMFSSTELVTEIDNLSTSYTKDIRLFGENMYYRAGMKKFRDTTKRARKKDTLYLDVLPIFPPQQQQDILETAIANARGTIETLRGKKEEFKKKTKRLNKFEIALHEKYILAFACVILFFVGAPLGAIIRKGGMGLPMVIAILLFLTYHFIGIFAKNSAEDGSVHPFIASWLSTLIMLPLGIWLTYRATTDQGVFDFDAFGQRFKWLFKKKEEPAVANTGERQLLLTQQERAMILSKDNDQLKDILKNYRQYDYSEDVRLAALKRLKEKGISEVELKISGDFENTKYNDAAKAFKNFTNYSKKALLFYIISMVSILFLIASLIFKFPLGEGLVKVLGIVRYVLFGFFYLFVIMAFVNHIKFYKAIQKERDNGIWILVLLLGLVIYGFVAGSFKKKMKEDLEMIR